MRFGEILLSKQNVEWAEKYLRYNELKTILNDIVSEKIKAVSTTIVAPPTPTTAAKLVPSHAEYDSYNQFVTLLDANIESIERFYEEKVKLFGVEIEFYRMKLENIQKDTLSKQKLAQHVYETYIQSLHLRQFVTVNLLGISKLLKKHDKVTCGSPTLSEVYKQRLSTSSPLASKHVLDEIIEAIEGIYKALSDEALEKRLRIERPLAPRTLPFHFAERYEAFLIDMDGVIYHGNKILPGVHEFLAFLKSRNKKFLFLTNSSDKTRKMLKDKLARLGITDVSEDNFYTSALSTVRFLCNQHKLTHGSVENGEVDSVPKTRVYALGEDGLFKAIADNANELELVTERHAAVVPDFVVVGETTTIGYDDITTAINYVRRGAKLLGTNLDTVDKVETGFAPSVGSLIAPIQAATGVAPYYLGKPNPLMLSFGINLLGARRDETLIIGDRMDTDIIGGLEAGIDTMLVLSGVTTVPDLAKFAFRPTHILRGVNELVQVIYANTPSRKDLCKMLGVQYESTESLYC